MKKSMIGLMLAGLLLIGSSAFAGDGDVLVNGKIGIGTTAPAGPLHVYVPSSTSNTERVTEISYASSGARKWAVKTNTYSILSGLMYQVWSDDGTTVNSTPLFLASNGKVAINSSDWPVHQLELNGSAQATGNWYSGSDVRFKKDIAPLQDSLAKILQLQGVSYNLKKDAFPKLAFEATPQVGLIAQDVEKIVPEVVATGDDGYKAIAYERLIPLLIEAIKEQQAEINDLKAKLK